MSNVIFLSVMFCTKLLYVVLYLGSRLFLNPIMSSANCVEILSMFGISTLFTVFRYAVRCFLRSRKAAMKWFGDVNCSVTSPSFSSKSDQFSMSSFIIDFSLYQWYTCFNSTNGM